MLRLRGSAASLHSRSAQHDSQIRFTCGVHPVLEDPLVRVSPPRFHTLARNSDICHAERRSEESEATLTAESKHPYLRHTSSTGTTLQPDRPSAGSFERSM